VARNENDFFLFIGSTLSETSTSQLKTSGIQYRQKMLESGEQNWQKIIDLLSSPDLIGALVKFSNYNLRALASDRFRDLAGGLIGAIGGVRHIVFMHETTLEAEDRIRRGVIDDSALEGEPDNPATINNPDLEEAFWPRDDDENESYYEEYRFFIAERRRQHFEAPNREVFDFVRPLLESNSIVVLPYRTNAELSVMARNFINEIESHLLFRIYIPSGRLWSNEADKLLSLFRDWLGRVRNQRVRQDGYSTAQGQVYEFYAESASEIVALGEEFEQFSNFMKLCSTEPTAAMELLKAQHVDRFVIADIVERYGKEARRLKIDLRHDLESKTLSIRHRLESELVDANVPDAVLNSIVESIVPRIDGLDDIVAAAIGGSRISSLPASVTVNVNPQIIGSVQGIVAQHFNGTAKFGAEAQEILRLIDQYGNNQREELTSALHELEDEDARPQERITARQRLKAFLYYVGNQAGQVGTGLLQKYLEMRFGMGG
jgi:hypothetical protein